MADALYGEKGVVRTDLYCHACSKTFVAELDFDINGQHIAECPYCGHEHCRVIRDGTITGDRWSRADSLPTIRVSPNSVWKASVLQGRTSTVASFIRDRWLQRSDLQL